MKALACEFTLVYAKLYRKAGLQIKLLSASSQISSSDAFMDRVVTRSVNRNHEAVMLIVVRSPPEGGWTVMAYGKQCRPGKSFRHTIVKTHHVPSFIGGDAATRLIGLQPAQYHDSTREAERHAKRFVFANLYSRVPTCMCCLRQRSSL